MLQEPAPHAGRSGHPRCSQSWRPCLASEMLLLWGTSDLLEIAWTWLNDFHELNRPCCFHSEPWTKRKSQGAPLLADQRRTCRKRSWLDLQIFATCATEYTFNVFLGCLKWSYMSLKPLLPKFLQRHSSCQRLPVTDSKLLAKAWAPACRAFSCTNNQHLLACSLTS